MTTTLNARKRQWYKETGTEQCCYCCRVESETDSRRHSARPPPVPWSPRRLHNARHLHRTVSRIVRPNEQFTIVNARRLHFVVHRHSWIRAKRIHDSSKRNEESNRYYFASVCSTQVQVDFDCGDVERCRRLMRPVRQSTEWRRQPNRQRSLQSDQSSHNRFKKCNQLKVRKGKGIQWYLCRNRGNLQKMNSFKGRSEANKNEKPLELVGINVNYQQFSTRMYRYCFRCCCCLKNLLGQMWMLCVISTN